jgi:signal transduction histidine kinase
MRLADFISDHTESILTEWEAFARQLKPGAAMTTLALRDDAADILRATTHDMRAVQSSRQQTTKSMGHAPADDDSDRLDSASSRHGLARVDSSFDLVELVSEYRALRASVLRLWRDSNPQPHAQDLDDVTRFNESIDQSLAVTVRSYTKRVDRSRHMFLAMLGHDLRNPLAAIRMAAQVVLRRSAGADADSARSLHMIGDNAQAISRLVTDLIDFAATGLGRGVPLTRSTVDLQPICDDVVNAFRSLHPNRDIRFIRAGDLVGQWDAARLRQVVSNLMGNAVQHGVLDGPVELSVVPSGAGVSISVHNEGDPIPRERLPTLFDPLVRYASPESLTQRASGSIGLGLYIVRAIASAHGGTVEVVSLPGLGTTFTVHLPRTAPPLPAGAP